MSTDVQRWYAHGPRAYGPTMDKKPDGEWVRFIDHEPAVQAARDEGWNAALEAAQDELITSADRNRVAALRRPVQP